MENRKEFRTQLHKEETQEEKLPQPKVEPEVYQSKYCPVECVSEVRRRMITNEIGRVLAFSSIDTPEGMEKLYRYLNGTGEKEVLESFLRH